MLNNLRKEMKNNAQSLFLRMLNAFNPCMQVPGSRDMNGEQSGVGGGNAEFSHSLHTVRAYAVL